ncbi:MAG: hypothetical protein Q9167_005608 [Letrouitia subvulpina]
MPLPHENIQATRIFEDTPPKRSISPGTSNGRTHDGVRNWLIATTRENQPPEELVDEHHEQPREASCQPSDEDYAPSEKVSFKGKSKREAKAKRNARGGWIREKIHDGSYGKDLKKPDSDFKPKEKHETPNRGLEYRDIRLRKEASGNYAVVRSPGAKKNTQIVLTREWFGTGKLRRRVIPSQNTDGAAVKANEAPPLHWCKSSCTHENVVKGNLKQEQVPATTKPNSTSPSPAKFQPKKTKIIIPLPQDGDVSISRENRAPPAVSSPQKNEEIVTRPPLASNTSAKETYTALASQNDYPEKKREAQEAEKDATKDEKEEEMPKGEHHNAQAPSPNEIYPQGQILISCPIQNPTESSHLQYIAVDGSVIYQTSISARECPLCNSESPTFPQRSQGEPQHQSTRCPSTAPERGKPQPLKLVTNTPLRPSTAILRAHIHFPLLPTPSKTLQNRTTAGGLHLEISIAAVKFDPQRLVDIVEIHLQEQGKLVKAQHENS